MTLDLARGAAGQILEGHEMHLARALVAGERCTAERFHRRCIEIIGLARDQRDRDFSPAWVPLAHDHRIADARIRQQHALDFGGVDVLAAGFDHVFRAIDESNEPSGLRMNISPMRKRPPAKSLRLVSGAFQ